jgi:alkanesulfonate monooxygenase SsuD/methylene tetrahydromethanopterin reductase-like flavin-dependent oxidoreductase (luciferase family)
VLDGVTLDDWRVGRLVGTVDDVREQAEEWAALGVETLIVGPGALPFHVASLDDVRTIAAALVTSSADVAAVTSEERGVT